MVPDAEFQRAFLASEASLRALDRQQRILEDLRARTGVLLAAASLSASLLGGRAFVGDISVLLSGTAAAALAIALILGVSILVPRRTLIFSAAGSVLYRDLRDVDDPCEQHRYLAYWLDAFGDANHEPIQLLTRRFEIAAGALVVQIATSILAVTTTLS